MYAVIRASGKQYRVTPNAVLAVDRIEAEPGQTVTFGEVLMVGGTDGVKIGAPLLNGVSVAATVLEQKKDDKVLIFKKRRRKNSRRLRGFRRQLTVLRIGDITA